MRCLVPFPCCLFQDNSQKSLKMIVHPLDGGFDILPLDLNQGAQTGKLIPPKICHNGPKCNYCKYLKKNYLRNTRRLLKLVINFYFFKSKSRLSNHSSHILHIHFIIISHSLHIYFTFTSYLFHINFIFISH